MEIRLLAEGSGDEPVLEEINREAIPECERNSLEDLRRTGAEVLGIYEDRAPVGFMVTRRYRNILYLAYFAVRSDLRSRGIGGRALRELTAGNPESRVVVEFESPDERCADSEMRLRRKGFYLRNGFHETGWFTFYDGTEFEIACSRPDYDPAEFGDFVAWLGTVVSDHIPQPYRKDR